MTRTKHSCELDVGSGSMLPKNCRYRALRKLGQISPYHPDTQYHYRSYPTVIAERQRNLLEEGFHMIHPLSLFSLTWTIVMLFVNLFHMMVSSYRMIYIVSPLENFEPHVLDHILLGLHIVCILDIVIRFNTGYISGFEGNIVMSRELVARRYIRGWFLWDALSCAPVAFVVLSLRMRAPRHLLVAHLLPLIRLARLPTVISYLRTFTKLFTKLYLLHETVCLAVLFVVSVHVCACAFFAIPVARYYWFNDVAGTLNIKSFLSSSPESFLSQDRYTLYTKALLASLSAFFGTGYSTFKSYTKEETAVHAIVILYASLFMVYVIVFSIKLYLTIYGSTIKYHELMSQVEAYMRLKQFPKSLKRRVRAFYQYRYQNRYIGDEDPSKYLSDDLSTEIGLYTRRRLVDKTKLFDGVPVDVVGAVLGCLSPEVYLSNDLVLSAGDIGDCMYFIATGTVAVYSLKGIEVCHLEDGAHFGEVALLMSDRKRVATVVAVEITTLYRLGETDFRLHVSSNAMLYERLKQLASRRMHETVLLDEAFQRDCLSAPKDDSGLPPSAR